MAKIKIVRPGYMAFKCPGCGDTHEIPCDRWQFNGSVDKPTFRPSLLVTSGHYCTGAKGDACWCTYEGLAPFHCYRCHSFITEGKIQFLSDCSHSLAGQTVDMEEIT